MAAKDPQQLIGWLLKVCILVALLALFACILALVMQRYLIASAMGVLVLLQIVNYWQWKKKKK